MSSATAFAARASLSDNAKALSYCCCSSSRRESPRLLPSHSTYSPTSVFIGSVYRYWCFVHLFLVEDTARNTILAGGSSTVFRIQRLLFDEEPLRFQDPHDTCSREYRQIGFPNKRSPNHCVSCEHDRAKVQKSVNGDCKEKEGAPPGLDSVEDDK